MFSMGNFSELPVRYSISGFFSVGMLWLYSSKL
jgi:hypothetical protein